MPNFNIPFVPLCVPAYMSLAFLEGLLVMLFLESSQGLRSKPTMFFYFSFSADDLTFVNPVKRNASVRRSSLCWEQIFSPLSAKATVGQQVAREEGRKRQGPSHWVCTFSFLIILSSYFFVYLFRERVFLSHPSCPGTHYIDQAGLELTEILLPMPPTC